MSSRKVDWMGVYVKDPGPDIIGSLTITFFSRLIVGALERENLLVCLPDLPKITTAVAMKEILVTVVVNDLSRSLRVISNELDQCGLLEHSHLGWRDFDEQFWRDEQPKNPVITFEQRMADSRTWGDQALSMLNALKMLRSALLIAQQGMPKPPPNP